MMRKFGALLGAAALVALATPAAAADVYNSGSTKDAPAPVVLPYGLYVSAGAGGSFTNTNVTIDKINPADFGFGGFNGDIRAGADYRIPNSSWIVGAFGGVNYEGFRGKIKVISLNPGYVSSPLSGSSATLTTSGLTTTQIGIINTELASGAPLTSAMSGFGSVGSFNPSALTYNPAATSTNYVDSDQGWGFEGGFRVGRIFNNTSLLYALAAWQGQTLNLNNTGKSTLLEGIKVGAGLEIDLTNKWFFGSEIDWIDYGDWNFNGGDGNTVKVTETELKATARLGYRF